VPFRTGKSHLVSVLWPAWEWTVRPATSFLTTSYSADLAIRDAATFGRIVELAKGEPRTEGARS